MTEPKHVNIQPLLSDKARCILTGVILVTEDGGRWVRGDLYMIGWHTFIVSCATLEGKSAAWVYGNAAVPVNARTVSVPLDMLFEKRGVAVFSTEAATLNEAAQEYIREHDGRLA